MADIVRKKVKAASAIGKIYARVFSAAQVQQDCSGLFLVVESIDYLQDDGRRKPRIRRRKIIIPEAFAETVALAKRVGNSLRACIFDDGTDLLQVESIEPADFARAPVEC